MTPEPRLRVCALLRRRERLLLIRHEKDGRAAWLLPGGGVQASETLVEALERELAEEIGLERGLAFEGPVAIAESIPPAGAPGKHVVHVVFAADLGERSLDAAVSTDAAVRGHALFAPAELDGLVLHPPIQRFLQAWRPGDPCRALGGLWQP